MTNAFVAFVLVCAAFLLVSSLLVPSSKVIEPRFKTQQEIEFNKTMDNLFINGTVNGEGWARHAIWRFIKSNLRASVFRIKEWDYYATYIGKEKMWICMTISDLGYAALYSLSVIDLKLKKYAQQDEIRFLTLGKTNFPKTSLHNHDISFNGANLKLRFEKDGTKRTIRAQAPKLVLPNGKVGIDADFAMVQNTTMESICIQTTWAENRKCFYLNEKVNGLETRGTVKVGNENINILEDSYTVLDWGRGYWTYENTWYWASATGKANDHKIGFNFGYGFSDRSPATENAIFYDDVVHKLDDVTFNIPEEGFLHPWTVTSKDGRVNLKFVPDVNRHADMNFVVIKSIQNQIFGTFSGTLKLDNGVVVKIDDIHGFAEKVYNRW